MTNWLGLVVALANLAVNIWATVLIRRQNGGKPNKPVGQHRKKR